MQNKKTVLDENATIYQRNSEKKVKESLKSMSFRDKVAYFKDYYLKTVLVSIVILSIFAYFLNIFVFSKKENMLTVIITDGYQLDDYKSSQSQIQQIIGLSDKNQTTMIEAIYNPDRRLFDMLKDNSIDILVMNKEYFDKYNSVDILEDLSKVMTADELSTIQSKLATNKVYVHGNNDTLTATDKTAPFGIKVTQDHFIKGITPYTKEIYIGIPKGAKHLVNAKKTLIYLAK